jgi:hypothetical protein
MRPHPSAATLVSALTLTVLASGCSAPTTEAADPVVTPTMTATSSSAATPAPSATAARPSTAAPTKPAPSTPAPVKRTEADLRKALLGLKDMPAGFAVEADDDGGDEKATTRRNECKALAKLLNADTLPGSRADAGTAFSGGPDGPFLQESIDAMGDAAAARTFVTGYRTAVKKCRTLSLTIGGAGTSTLAVREISFADIGDTSFAASFRATSGPLEGFELIQAASQTADLVVSMSAIDLDPLDAEAATQDAVDKAQTKLGTSGDRA